MTLNREILVFENPHILTNFLLKQWMNWTQEAVKERGRFTVALSGGRTPTEFYTRLSGLEEFDLWNKTHIFFADERFVSWEDKESNFRMIQQNLLHYISIPQHNVHPIRTHFETVGLATEDYKNELIHFFGVKPGFFPRFDLMLLGIGDDGHTASLFPNQEGVDDPNRLTIPTILPYIKHERVSLTLSVINRARHIVFLVQGPQKAKIIKEILENKNMNLPASKVNPSEGNLTFLLDKSAASMLSARYSVSPYPEALSFNPSS